ncbi:hypothetical protein HNY73_007088 [Argiope bruennichi]|uniref:Uncharacterized protein n=1 Tax=Argiope bruennichi TaxID=94029 RepID=A0A8T0FFX1_ARGBR|nr:hypothetical protein HNY73_007088 [Argiope bruennichi]
MHRAASGLDTCDISPIKTSNKHNITPQRTRRKTSRRDQGSKKKEIKLTVQELLENLNQCQVPECSSNVQPVQYIKLLENWMTKQKVDGAIKNTVKNKKGVKKRPRQVIEELKKFIETIPRLNNQAKIDNNSGQNNTSENKQELDNSNNSSKLNISSKSFLAGDSTDNDSTDELWGDADNSFIVKATQELETLNTVSTDNPSYEDIVSTIPETAPNDVQEQKRHSCGNRLTLDEYNDFLEQLTNVDWDSDMEEWDNGFLIGEDELSQIPDDILSGNAESSNRNTAASKNEASKIVSSVLCTNTSKSSTEESKSHSLDEVEVVVMQNNNTELYNSFEDESFEDESLLCQPDILSRIDEVENLMSQQPKCTPEEIKKKKDEAIKRRQKSKAKSRR